MPQHVPTRQLELAAIPTADAESIEVIRFAQTYNGYAKLGMDGVSSISKRLKANGTGGFSLDELRAALFARQRAHYHQGGAWPGQPDTLMNQMRELVAEIRQRVDAGAPARGLRRTEDRRVDGRHHDGPGGRHRKRRE